MPARTEGRRIGAERPAAGESSVRDRGGLWVAGQVVLMGAVGATGWFTRGAWEGGFAFVSGLVLLVAGAALGIAGALSLGRNRTIFPEPLARGQLVRSGIYTHVRHPLYASVMLLSFAWALCLCSPAGLVAAALLSGFLLLKTGSEERRLLRRFPDYAGYRQQTKRFLPWIF